jgi:MFS family permease
MEQGVAVVGRSPPFWPSVLTCGFVELFSWAALYYTVPVLFDLAARDTGWSLAGMTAGYSGSLVLSALLSPQVGAVVDRHGPRHLVTAGAVVGAVGLTVVAVAPQPALAVLGMALVGLGQATTLYPPVFAALTIWHGERAASALTVVSLFGGASSALLAPVLAPVAEAVGWRESLVAVAIGYALVTAPLAWWGLVTPWTGSSATHPGLDVPGIVRSRRFRAAQTSMVLAGTALYAVTLNLVPLARELGHSYATAAVAFGLVGAGQVIGRLAYLPLVRMGDARQRMSVVVVAASLAVAALAVAPGTVGLMCAALLAGAVRGAHTLTTTLGVADRWGRMAFGRLSGAFQRPVALGAAVAPFAGAVLASAIGGFQAAALAFAVLTLVGVVAARIS